MEAGLFSCDVFIDLKKAFDKVDHTVLLCKSSKYGIRGIINDWFVSYLTNRVFSHDVTSAILVSQNNETAAMLVSQTSPVGDELFSYANDFFCSKTFA